MDHHEVDWVTVHHTGSESQCREHSLVLQAIGIAHEIRRNHEEFIILVPAADAERSRSELRAYEVENPSTNPVTHMSSRRAGGWRGVLWFVGILLLMMTLEEFQAFHLDWSAIGKTDAVLIRQGQWWRTVTALTLHADASHLLSNLVTGSLFGLFAGKSFGSGLAWFSIVMAGAFGNLLNAWIRPSGHTSIGASTAVFACVGLLVAHAWRQSQESHPSTLQRWTPWIGGLLLLSFLGTGGGRTDVASHVFGFGCGTACGALMAKLGDRVYAPQAQWWFGVAALSTVVVSWAIALVPYVLRR